MLTARPETALVALLPEFSPQPDLSGMRLPAELRIPEVLVLPYRYTDFREEAKMDTRSLMATRALWDSEGGD